MSNFRKRKYANEIAKSKNLQITRMEDGNLRIDHDALRRVFTRPELHGKKFAIISIAGKMRTGKSFLLNFVLRYLRRRGWENDDWIGDDDCAVDADGLIFAGGTERCTTGIRIFDEIFEVPVSSNESMMVMLMDTQGLFDNKTPEIVNKSLLTLTTLISSVQIFNSKENIDSQSMGYLKTCVDFALQTAEASTNQGSQTDGYMKLQNIMFLVRDFPEDDAEENDSNEVLNDSYFEVGHGFSFSAEENSYSAEFGNRSYSESSKECSSEDKKDSYGLEIGSRYLQDILLSNEGGEELVKIRKSIKKSFDKVECFAMPHPGLPATKKTFQARNRDLDEEFRVYVKTFVEHIVSPHKLVPKRSSTKAITPREMLNMIAGCDTIFAEKMINARNMMKMNGKAYFSSLCQEAIEEYDNIMKDANDKELWQCHYHAKNTAIHKLSNAKFVGDDDSENWKNHYLKHFSTVCGDHFDILKRENEVRLEKKELNIKIVVQDYESRMKRELLNPISDEQFEELHVKHQQDVCETHKDCIDFETLCNRVNQVCAKLELENKHRREAAERERIRRQKDENRRKLRQEKKEQRTKVAIEDYETRMKSGLHQPLSGEDFQSLHNMYEQTIRVKYEYSVDLESLRKRMHRVYENLEEKNTRRREAAVREQAMREMEEEKRKLAEEKRRMEQENQKLSQWMQEQRKAEERQQQIVERLRIQQEQMKKEEENKRLVDRLVYESKNTWDKFVPTYPDDSAMQRKKKDIMLKLSTQFLNKAGPVQGDLHGQLLQSLSSHYEDAKRRNDQQWSERQAREQQRRLEEENAKKRLAEQLLSESLNSWDIFLVKYPDNDAMWKKKLEISSRLCNEFSNKAGKSAEYNRFVENLNRHYKDAERQNEQNWSLVTQKINNTVDEIVLKIRSGYSKIMVDRHLEEQAIKTRFRHILETNAKDYIDIDFESERAELYFTRRLKQKCDEAMGDILRQNREYQPSNNLKESKTVPWYKHAFNFVKTVAKFAGPIVSLLLL